jgi:hypothetical protein
MYYPIYIFYVSLVAGLFISLDVYLFRVIYKLSVRFKVINLFAFLLLFLCVVW